MKGAMEIQALKLVVSEEGVNSLLAAYVPEDAAVENLRVRIAGEGVSILGNYPTVFGKVPFETLWEMGIVAGRVHARLVALKVSGVPGNMFRKMVLDLIQEVLQREQGVVLEEETLRIDVEAVARSKNVLLLCNLRTMRCEAGRLLVEAGRE
jgi:hypothetical protein